MKTKKPLNRFWNRSPFFYKVRNLLLFRKIDLEKLNEINYNKYNPTETIPQIYVDINRRIFKESTVGLSDFDKAIQIAIWLRNHIKGGKGLGIDSENALKYMLKGGYGVCSDFCQVYNNFCVINNIKVREWGLKKIGSDLDGHAFNEIYDTELQKWICIDVSKSIYFKTISNSEPLSGIELFLQNRNKIDLHTTNFNSKYTPDDRMINKFYFSDQYVPFVIDKYVNYLYDKYLSKYKNLPIPIIHGVIILLNKSYVYKFITQTNSETKRKTYARSGVKNKVFKFLDILPNRLGYWFYHKMQHFTMKDVEFYYKANKSSLNIIQKILCKKDIDLKESNIVEIGSGWFPLMPYLFKVKLGVKNIYTFDINKHYNGKRIYNTSKIFSKALNISPHKKLPDFIKYFPNTNISDTPFSFSPKLIYSRFVLEHVQPNALLKIHQHLYDQTSKETKIIHLISPSDHRSYSDSSLSTYDFLKYSQPEWDSIQTKFDYHNRLRLPDYISIFEKSNYKVEYLTYEKISKDSKKYKMFKDLNIHNDFKIYTEEELLASSIVVLLGK